MAFRFLLILENELCISFMTWVTQNKQFRVSPRIWNAFRKTVHSETLCYYLFPGIFLQNVGAKIASRNNLFQPLIPFYTWGQPSPWEENEFIQCHSVELKIGGQILWFSSSVKLHFNWKGKTEDSYVSLVLWSWASFVPQKLHVLPIVCGFPMLILGLYPELKRHHP